MNEHDEPDVSESVNGTLDALGEHGYTDGMQVHGDAVERTADAAGAAASHAADAAHGAADAAAHGTPQAGDTISHVVNWVTHHVSPAPGVTESAEAAVARGGVGTDPVVATWELFPGIAIPLPVGTNAHFLMLFLAAAFLLIAFLVLYKHSARVPSGFTNFLEVLVKFVRDDICIPSFGESDGRKLTPVFATFFFFILTINLMGLIPIFSTATGNLSVTLGLSTITFILMTLGGMIVHNPLGWFKAFVPHGVPAPVLVVIVPLELIGLVVKSFALAMRLFANMLAGHIVLFSFIGMSVAFGMYGKPAAALAVGVYLLEVFVAFLQAYVFTLLSAIFVGQVYHPDH